MPTKTEYEYVKPEKRRQVKSLRVSIGLFETEESSRGAVGSLSANVSMIDDQQNVISTHQFSEEDLPSSAVSFLNDIKASMFSLLNVTSVEVEVPETEVSVVPAEEPSVAESGDPISIPED